MHRAVSDFVAISCGDFAPSSGPAGKPRQEDVAEDRSLELVETAIEASLVMHVGRALSIVTKGPRLERGPQLLTKVSSERSDQILFDLLAGVFFTLEPARHPAAT